MVFVPEHVADPSDAGPTDFRPKFLEFVRNTPRRLGDNLDRSLNGESIDVRFNSTAASEVSLWNENGTLITKVIAREGSVTIPSIGLPRGCYFVSVRSNDAVATQKIAIE